MVPGQKDKTTLLIDPVAMTEGATQTASFDTQGADYATLTIAISSNTNTGPTISVLDCDTTVVTDHVTIVADASDVDVSGSAIQVVYHIDLRDRKRYLRLTVSTGTSVNDDVVVAAVGVLSRLDQTPSGTAEMVGGTNDTVTIVPS